MRKVVITNDFQKQIDMFHNLCGDIEWSGVCFFNVDTDLSNNDCIITPKYIFPMDVGTGAATDFDYSDVILDAYDQLPGAEDCREGIIHTHHRMGAFFSGTDTSELKENAKNYDFYFSLVVDYQKNYKAKIAIKPTSVVAVIDRPSGRYELATSDTEVFFIDLHVEYEQGINPVDDLMYQRMISLISTNKQREEEKKKNTPAKWTAPASASPASYPTSRYDKYSANGGRTLPFQRETFQKGGETNKKDKKSKSVGTEKQFDFLAKWIAQDYKNTTLLYTTMIDVDKEQRQYPPQSEKEALEYYEGQLEDSFDQFFEYCYGEPMDIYVTNHYSNGTPVTYLLNKFIETFTRMSSHNEYAYLIDIYLNVLNKIKRDVEFVYNIH